MELKLRDIEFQLLRQRLLMFMETMAVHSEILGTTTVP
jgi:hypothetical protein